MGKPRNPENIIVGAVFSILLAIGSIAALNACLRHDVSISLAEKRVLSSFPTTSDYDRDPARFVAQIESFYNDHFPGRLAVTTLRNATAYYLFSASMAPDMCAIGENQWLFLANPSAADAQSNLSKFPNGKLENWARIFDARRAELAKRGIKYICIIAPEKGTIYPEFLPRGWRKQAGKSRLNELQDYLKTHTAVDFVDAKAVLSLAKQHGGPILYHTNDSHWNDYGAFLVVQEVFRHLNPESHSVTPFTQSEYQYAPGSHRGDLADVLGLGELLIDQTSPQVALQRAQSKLDSQAVCPRFDGGIVGTTAPSCAWKTKDRSLPRALVFHDSFMYPMMPYLSQRFSFIEFQLSQEMPLPVVVSEKPNIVIDEIAERHLYDRDPQNVPMFVGPELATKLESTFPQPVATFAQKFVLEAASCCKTQSSYSVKLLWRSKVQTRLDYTVGIHAIDLAARTTEHFIEYRQDCFSHMVAPDTRWIDEVTISRRPGLTADHLAIMLLRNSHLLSCDASEKYYGTAEVPMIERHEIEHAYLQANSEGEERQRRHN
jgi:alginate O-acetyltransferase complex protein AlgJ